MPFNLDDYEPVQSRFARFIDWANGQESFYAVVSEMLSPPGAEICVFKTSILIDGVVIATGHAEEVRGQGNVNRTSHVENCETSSLGRCLSNFPKHNFAGSDVNKRPSREEMAKVQRMNTSNGPAVERGTDSRMPSVTVTQPAGLASEKQVYFASSFYKKDGREAPKKWLMTLTSKEISALIDDLKAGNFPEPDLSEEAPF
jgi:hypothetical protein